MKTLRIIKTQGPHKPSTSEISKKVNLFLNKPSERLSLKELRQIKSLLRYLRARVKHSYFEGLCQFKYDRSNLLDIIKPSEEYYKSNYHLHSAESARRFLIRYCNDTSKYRYTKEYICYEDLTQEVVEKIVDWALMRGKCNNSGMRIAAIHTYISYIIASLRHASRLGLINYQVSISLFFLCYHQPPEDIAVEKLKNYKSTKQNPWYQIAADLFVIRHLARKISPTDLVRLKGKNWKGDEITIVRSKSRKGSAFKIKVTEELSNRILKYVNKNITPDEYIFPFIDANLGEREQSKKIHIFVININRYLKKIAEELDIEPFSFYCARDASDTFGNQAIKQNS